MYVGKPIFNQCMQMKKIEMWNWKLCLMQAYKFASMKFNAHTYVTYHFRFRFFVWMVPKLQTISNSILYYSQTLYFIWHFYWNEWFS